jgi:putative transposase
MKMREHRQGHIHLIAAPLLVKDSLLKGLIGNWKDFLNTALGDDDVRLFQLHERTGRPLGDNSFIEKLESLLKMKLKKKKSGRKRKEK